MWGLSAAMLRGGQFDRLPAHDLPAVLPEAPDITAAIVPNLQEYFERSV